MARTQQRLPYQLRIKFSASIEDVEDWLSTNCDGKFAYNLEGIIETESIFSKLDVLFSFEHDSDRQAFKEAVKVGTF